MIINVTLFLKGWLLHPCWKISYPSSLVLCCWPQQCPHCPQLQPQLLHLLLGGEEVQGGAEVLHEVPAGHDAQADQASGSQGLGIWIMSLFIILQIHNYYHICAETSHSWTELTLFQLFNPPTRGIIVSVHSTCKYSTPALCQYKTHRGSQLVIKSNKTKIKFCLNLGVAYKKNNGIFNRGPDSNTYKLRWRGENGSRITSNHLKRILKYFNLLDNTSTPLDVPPRLP